MKTTRIVTSLPASVTNEFKSLIKEASTGKGVSSFILQVFDNGTAKDLYLDVNDAPVVAKIMTKMWAKAEPIKFI